MTTREKMAEKLVSVAEDNQPSVGGRWAAGEDPAKRQQIIEGARHVFMKMGFDAASMNDVTREAGVSKGTLYVYFANKEDLFTAMMEDQRDKFVAMIRSALAEHEGLRESLYQFGIVFVTHLTDEKVIAAMRTVIGVRDRMPSLCRRFFSGPENVRTVLQDFLSRQVAEGNLEIDDLDMAARHFLDLSSSSFFKLRLFGDMEVAPPPEQIDYTIRGAIRVFMAAYGAKQKKLV
jgi:AcrR family transcriptional regulator